MEMSKRRIPTLAELAPMPGHYPLIPELTARDSRCSAGRSIAKTMTIKLPGISPWPKRMAPFSSILGNLPG
jgi:hypothetical protein